MIGFLAFDTPTLLPSLSAASSHMLNDLKADEVELGSYCLSTAGTGPCQTLNSSASQPLMFTKFLFIPCGIYGLLFYIILLAPYQPLFQILTYFLSDNSLTLHLGDFNIHVDCQ